VAVPRVASVRPARPPAAWPADASATSTATTSVRIGRPTVTGRSASSARVRSAVGCQAEGRDGTHHAPVASCGTSGPSRAAVDPEDIHHQAGCFPYIVICQSAAQLACRPARIAPGWSGILRQLARLGRARRPICATQTGAIPWLPSAMCAVSGRASATTCRTRTAVRRAAGTRTFSVSAQWWERRHAG
jgi:hypothetical protein